MTARAQKIDTIINAMNAITNTLLWATAIVLALAVHIAG